MSLRLCVVASMFAFLSACGGESNNTSAAATPLISAPCPVPASFETQVGKVIEQTNAFRVEMNLSALGTSPALTAAAQAHACDMATTGRFSHTGSGGTTPGDRAKTAGYSWDFVAENIARGQRFADGAVGGWKNSPPHRKNMLNENPRDIGIGIAASATGELFWVMVLAGRL